jgi:hypothetical protein
LRTIIQHRGISLIEVLLAMVIAIGAVGTLAHLAVVSTRVNTSARSSTLASILAKQKMEQLRSLAWSFDSNGQPVSDTGTDVAAFPEQAFGGGGLTPSPSDSLVHDVDGYCDFLDGGGRWLGAGRLPPGTVYSRRWAIEPLASAPDRTVLLQVAVFGQAPRIPLARIVSIRTRKVP